MKLGIIGFGAMGKTHLDPIIKRVNDNSPYEKIDVIGVYDIDPERCALAESLGLRSFASAEKLIAAVEAVVVATPNDVHLPYVLMAIEAGRSVIVEKPLAMNSDEAAKMYSAAKEHGVVFTPHQNRRWDKDYCAVKELYKNPSDIGRIYLIESRVMGSNGIPGAWRRKVAQGGGMMLDWGVHLIDQAVSMIDEDIVSVYCRYSYEAGEEVDDGFALEITFDSGLVYRIVVDTNSFIELPRWRIAGSDGTAVIHDWRASADTTLDIVSVLVRNDDKLEGVMAGNGLTKTMAKRRSETTASKSIPVLMPDRTELYNNFAKAVREGAPTIIKESEAMRVMKVMEAAARSAKAREVIKERI